MPRRADDVEEKGEKMWLVYTFFFTFSSQKFVEHDSQCLFNFQRISVKTLTGFPLPWARNICIKAWLRSWKYSALKWESLHFN